MDNDYNSPFTSTKFLCHYIKTDQLIIYFCWPLLNLGNRQYDPNIAN